MNVLLAAGAGITLLGLLAMLFGFPINETSLGNALLIGGVVVLCTGLLIVSMWFVGRQLERIAKLLAANPALAAPPPHGQAIDLDMGHGPAAPVFPAPVINIEPATGRTEPVIAEAAPATAPQSAPDMPAETPATAERPRRNLLFESRRRQKPEPAADPKPAEPPAPVEEPARPSFDDTWTGKAPLPPPRPRPADPAASPEAAQPGQVTVLKSGVVDGMAYSLYSDGSIEAQMPKEGLVRFASLNDLRDYLDQRPEGS